MKKLITLLLVLAISLSLLAGCGGSDKDTSGDTNQENHDSEEEKVVIDTSIYSEKIDLVTPQQRSARKPALYPQCLRYEVHRIRLLPVGTSHRRLPR